MSNEVSSAHQISKEAGIAYPITIIQRGDKHMGEQEYIKVLNTQVKGDSQETNNMIILILVGMPSQEQDIAVLGLVVLDRTHQAHADCQLVKNGRHASYGGTEVYNGHWCHK